MFKIIIELFANYVLILSRLKELKHYTYIFIRNNLKFMVFNWNTKFTLFCKLMSYLAIHHLQLYNNYTKCFITSIDIF